MGWIIPDYATRWGNTTQAYISTCASEVRASPVNNGVMKVSYTVEETQQITNIEYTYDENGNVTGSNEVVVSQVVPVTLTSNVLIPGAWYMTCDFSVYPSKEHRIHSPENVIERIMVSKQVSVAEYEQNPNVFELLYMEVQDMFPSGHSD